MPLVPCPDCGREVSAQAPTCPGCGRQLRAATVAPSIWHSRNAGCLGCGVLVVVAAAIFVMTTCR